MIHGTRKLPTSLTRRMSAVLFGILPLLLCWSLAPDASAQARKETIPGVKNFGRVTNTYWRGGALTPEGVAELHKRGVTTIVDLRDEPSPGEPEACADLGIRYHKFPMNGHETPDPATIDKVLSIIQSTDGIVYVHCSAGKHRAGTICATYRMQVQGWTKEQAWEEQKSYGFGPPEEHPELYAYLYGNRSDTTRGYTTAAVGKTYKPGHASHSSSPNDESDGRKEKSSDSKKKKSDKDDEDDDEGEDDDDRDKGKNDDDDEGEDDDDRGKGKNDDDDEGEDDDRDSSSREGRKSSKSEPVSRAEAPPAKNSRSEIEPVAVMEESAEPSGVASRSAAAGPLDKLTVDSPYVGLESAVSNARSAGGSGDVVKIDLEVDEIHSTITWDVTFSSGLEVELDAFTGKVLASKSKAPAKMAILTPIGFEKGMGRQFKSFQDIIGFASQDAGKVVTEMELKRVKGRAEAMYEVVFLDGSTVYFNAESGAPIQGL